MWMKWKSCLYSQRQTSFALATGFQIELGIDYEHSVSINGTTMLFDRYIAVSLMTSAECQFFNKNFCSRFPENILRKIIRVSNSQYYFYEKR